MSRVRKDITGQRFGRWTVIRRDGRRGKGNRITWLCRCDCGNEGSIIGDSLRYGSSQSCGCLRAERTSQASRQHGGVGTRTYNIWMNMRGRCNAPNNKEFHNYGGRGISVCERWDSYTAFIADMGEAPPGLSIERINNDGNYEPENCKWATLKEQGRNRRTNRIVTYLGARMPLVDAIERSGVSANTIYTRIKLGWPPERWFIAPTKKRA